MKLGLKSLVFLAFLGMGCGDDSAGGTPAGGGGGVAIPTGGGGGGGTGGSATGGAGGVEVDAAVGGTAGVADDAGTDADEVPKPPRVLLLGAELNLQMTDLANKLKATGAFETVDVFDIGNPLCAPGAQTPTLAKLLEYDVALAHVLGLPPQTHYQLNDVLADYYDAGGRVVLASPFDGFLMGGRFGGHSCTDSNCAVKCTPIAKHYNLLVDGLLPMGKLVAESMGTVHEPESPLMKDVTSVTSAATLHLTEVTLDPDTVVVASWPDGSPMVVRGSVDGRKRVDLNFTPISLDAYPQGGFTGDGIQLIRNALLYQ